jgi:drug/metabolite transporter (DMT)-like permease
MKKSAKKQREYIWHLKVHFLVMLGVLMLITTGFSVYSMISQLHSGLNFGISSFYLLSSLVTPGLVLIFSYLLTPRQKTPLDRWFWVVLQAVVAMLIYTACQQLSYISTFLNMSVSQESWMINETIRLTISFIPVVIYFAYLYWLRKKVK